MGVIFAAKVISAVFVAALAASSAASHDFKMGALDISDPWSLPTTNGVTVAGGRAEGQYPRDRPPIVKL